MFVLSCTVRLICPAPPSKAKGTKSTSFLTQCVRNEVDLVPLACEDVPAQETLVCIAYA